MEDSKIISLLQNASTQNDGFIMLMNKFNQGLYWHIRRIVVTHQDADDVLQNVLIKVFRYIKGFEQKSSLYTWLYRIATNESLSFIKSSQKNKQIDNYADFVIFSLKADPYFDGDDIQIAVKEAIALLPEKQMLVFNMRYYDEMKYEEISKILNTSIGGLKASYHHALKKVQTIIKQKNMYYEF